MCEAITQETIAAATLAKAPPEVVEKVEADRAAAAAAAGAAALEAAEADEDVALPPELKDELNADDDEALLGKE